MIFVKVCGLTNYEDAQAAFIAGADALGFVFWKGSPRAVSAGAVAPWLAGLPEGTMKVGVFVNGRLDEIARTVEKCGLDAVQLHGEESREYVRDLKKLVPIRIIRALRPKPGEAVSVSVDPGVDMLLVDRFKPGTYGGTGEKADWELVKQMTKLPAPVILSGGLSAENVREACEKVKPYGVDASSSLEKAPGIKDHAKIKEFVANAKKQTRSSV